jgi:parallel beta-helix repeat protein
MFQFYSFPRFSISGAKRLTLNSAVAFGLIINPHLVRAEQDSTRLKSTRGRLIMLKKIFIRALLCIFGIFAPTLVSAACAPAPTSSLVVSVRDEGATGNGVTDDTAAIQAAINQVAGTGGTVLVPDGAYMIDAVTRLYLKSNMTLSMSSGAVLKAIPNNQSGYAIIQIENVSDVNVMGGTVQGERAQHTGTTGEYGMGIKIYGSNNIVIEGVTAKDTWGDGFYLGGASTVNTTFCSVIADNNRRQGMSITSADGVVIKNSIFKNTNGTRPMTGIAVEPNEGDSVNDVQILNSQFLNNYGGGFMTYLGASGVRSITNMTIDGNTMDNNGGGSIYAPGINISATSGLRITNNIVQNNRNDGIEIENGSTHNIVDRNTVSGNKANGIQIYDSTSSYNTISNNTVTGNTGRGIVDRGTGNMISGNTVQ